MYEDQTAPKPRHRWLGILIALGGLTVLLGLFYFRPVRRPAAGQHAAGMASRADRSSERRAQSLPGAHPALPGEPTAEETVARKLAQFAISRLEFAHALARRHNVQVSPDVERFFAAIQSGNWDEIETAFKKINGGDASAGHADRSPDVVPIWPAIIDAYGAAEQVHLWPAQQLLDYGNAILGALRPGMVYVGGTDNGRWIPELLNDTADGEHHIIVTQNGLADGMYLDYLRMQYDDHLANLSAEDSQRAFSEYIADAQKRLTHDQQFPDEPKQIRPGEDIRVTDGRIQVGGKVAVMAINERLLQTLMDKNPGISFAIQESFPLQGTYADALPLGPLMELRARDDQNTFTTDHAAQSIDYLRNTAQQVLSDPEALASESALKSYSHDTVAAANLLGAHNFPTQAEEAYRLAMQLWPANLESVSGLAEVLARTGRENEGRQLLADFAQRYPDERKNLEQSAAATLLLWNAHSPGR